MTEIQASPIFETSDAYTREYHVGRFIRIFVETFCHLGPVPNQPWRYGIHIACNGRSVHVTSDWSNTHATLAEAKAALETMLPGVLDRTKKAVEIILAPVKSS